MTYTAIYTKEKDGTYKSMTDSSYNSKKAFVEDLRRNGYHVTAVLTPEQITDIQTDDTPFLNGCKLSERLAAYIKQCM